MSVFDIFCEENVLRLAPHGKIDTSNAPDAQEEAERAREQFAHTSTVLDAQDLTYVSSAGLRVILRLRKEEPTLSVVNVSAEVYDILEMTGFTEMLPVSKAYRQVSVDGCEIIGRGAKGTVYRTSADTIVKVYRDRDSLPSIRCERELARKAFILGIPTAISYDIVKVGDLYGSVFELLNAKSFSALIAEDPDRIPEYVGLYADLLRQIHKTQVKPDDMPDIKDTIFLWCDAIRPYLDADVWEKIHALVTVVPDTMNMLHCDYHTNNVMMQNGEALLIDMDTLSHGHPIFELANVYITYVGFGEVNPAIVENFMGLPYDVCGKIWKTFLPRYLGTDDPARLLDVETKVRLLNYVRLMRHIVRRKVETDEQKETVALCRKRIPELLAHIDTLDF